MTSLLNKGLISAAMAGFLAVASSSAALAEGPDNRDQGTAMFDAGSLPGLSGSSPAIVAAVQSIANIATAFSVSITPALAAALESLGEALENAGPGSPEAAAAVAEVLSLAITPELAENPPDLSDSDAAKAVSFLENIATELGSHSITVPTTVLTLTSTLQAQLP